MAPTQRVHHYHAESRLLHADLRHPLTQEIKPQAYVKLAEHGGYLSEHAQDFKVEGFVSYKKAYTHVAGHRSSKEDHGWVTLATAAIEGLNVLDVVTADRVVGQIATEHPLVGHVPSVTFLGTRFENLQIAGSPVTVTLDLNICGKPPGVDTPYLEDPAFLRRVGYSGSFPDLPKQWEGYLKALAENKEPTKPAAFVEFSLVKSLSAGPWKSQGNMIEVPDFGKIFLAKLRVDCDTFHLTMLDLEMGCLAGGTMTMSSPITNGTTRP